MLANNSALEVGKIGLDLSAWEASVVSIVTVLALACYSFRCTALTYGLGIAIILMVWIRILSNFMLLKLHSKHPVILSALSILPGAVMVYAFMLDRYAERSWEDSKGGL